jgi:CRISPR/Cas system CSM-associated protein Csm4 (group 5 of RAMP superfamily)
MINKKLSFLQARKFKKWLNLKENNKTICCILTDEKLCGSQQ